MYDVMVFDHRLAEHRPLDSKAELVRFVVRPGQDGAPHRPEAITRAAAGDAVHFVYRAEVTVARIGGGQLRVR